MSQFSLSLTLRHLVVCANSCRRAPVQHLDMSGRQGLLRTILEAQETRGLTRSDDISRLLPAGNIRYHYDGIE